MATAGGRLVVSRRLLVDVLFDAPDGQLRRARSGLRVRRDGAHGSLTYKGPVQSGPVKSREEFETSVVDPDMAEQILRGLGYRPWFRGEKYREEYAIGPAHVVIDEAPIGVFIEVEAEPAEIEHAVRQLGRTPADYRLESYPRLYFAWCEAKGVRPGNMTFE